MTSLYGASVVNPSTKIMILLGILRFLNSKVMKCHLENENCRRIIKFKKNPTNVNRILNILWVFWSKFVFSCSEKIRTLMRKFGVYLRLQ